MSRPDWVPVAGWELKRMALKKDFVISTLLMPAIMLGVIYLIAWNKQRDASKVRKIAVVQIDASGNVAPATLPPLEHFTWTAPAADATTREALAATVREGKVEGAILIPPDFESQGSVEMIVRRENPGWRHAVEKHLLEQARIRRAAQRGITAADLVAFDKPVEIKQQVADPKARTSRADRIVAFALILLLITSLFVTNTYLAVGISGEKQARVTEVIVSAIHPQSWIDGKIVAYTLIGLFQVAMWIVTSLIAMILLSWTLPPSMNPAMIALFLVFTIVGYAFYVALYALVMATIKDLQSSSKFQAYLIFLPVLPLLVLDTMVESPDAPWIRVMSLLPPFSPFMMPVRISLAAAPAWEWMLALALLVAAAWLMRLAAGHAFRIGMLMYGKELTLPELVRWAREG